MKKVFLMAALFAVSGVIAEASAQVTKIVGITNNNSNSRDSDFHKPNRCPKSTKTPNVSYNSASTILNISFPSNGQGGKVEIYRNGAKVVGTAAPAGTSLSYVLLNYGKGDYTVIVSSGNTVVYSENMRVK